MKTKLDRLLESISPEKTIEQTYNRANEAIVSFNFAKAKVENWEQFKCCMARFLKHFDEKVLRLTKPIDVPLTEHWRYCITPLLKIYGSSGDITAFKLAHTGNEGGLYGVLKAFAMYKAEEYTKNEISARVHMYWEGLSTEEMLQAEKEYVSKHGNILPSELTCNGSSLMKSYLYKVLQKHPFIVQRLHQSNR